MAIRAKGRSTRTLRVGGLAARPLAEDDATALSALFERSYMVDRDEEERPSVEEIRHYYFSDPATNPVTDSVGLFTPDRVLVAYGWVFGGPDPARQARCELYGLVDPAHRGRGIGRQILAWTEQRGGVLLVDAGPGLSRTLECSVLESSRDRVALLRAAGYRPMRFFSRMERRLDGPVAARESREGLAVTTWRADLDEAIRDAHNDAFRDHWGFEPQSPDTWRYRYSDNPDFLPPASFVALDGPVIAGYVMSRSTDAQGLAANGPRAELATLGVRRDYRGGGVGSALITRVLDALRQGGFVGAILHVDTENTTGALRLYERHGFQSVRRHVAFGKVLRSVRHPQ